MDTESLKLLCIFHPSSRPPAAYCNSDRWPKDAEDFTISPPLHAGHMQSMRDYDLIPYAIRNVVQVLWQMDGVPISFHELCFSVLHSEITVARVIKTLRNIGVVEVSNGRRRPRGEMRAIEETYIKWTG